MNKKFDIKSLVLSAMFLALALVLPFLIGQIPQIGQMLCPMHIPVLLCGLICGWQWGGMVGFLAPLMRSMLFGMPVMFPNGIAMSFELMTYGIVIGVLFQLFRQKGVVGIYASLLPAMVVGRMVWGCARVILAGVAGSSFTWQLFLSGALLTAIPGIILQLVLIPGLMLALDRSGFYKM